MIHEDENKVWSNSDGGGDGGSITISSSKKLKQRKVPQRGLGVAQLEKIRMEEQQNEDFSSTLSSTSSSSLATNPLPNYPLTINNNYKASKLDLPYNPPSPPSSMPMNVSPPNPIFRPHLSPNTKNFNLGTIPSLNPTNGDEFGVGWPSIPVHGSVSFPNMWHPNSHQFSVDHKGENSIFRPHLSLPYETCSIAPLPDVLPRSTQRNQPLLSNSVMMVGMKRSCPFPLDNPQIPTLHSKFVPLSTHPLCRSDETTPGAFEGTTYNHLTSSIPIFREIPPCPSVMPEQVNSKKINKLENGTSHNAEFLRLTPSPTTSFTHPRLEQLCKFKTASSIEDSLMDSRKGSSSQHQLELLSFSPPTKLPTTTPVSSSTNHIHYNGEVGKNIDLNLRL
ncbi:uncharacterized protein LOC104891404 isoform X2 [Beta vulgaris subsp. vulgaris]|uniref:uncharacterized protein LOC104891404 isoform X2 n=1 Tax=Beta vulgaris subsp. vulgaris TaxID=3555 RepID=UPI002548C8E0|nr:uncharacterized protein LOC104891404 isoform X2 [Beta vulgaris subsp. vulgaris]